MERFKQLILSIAILYANMTFAQSNGENYDMRLRQNAKQIANYIELITNKATPLLERHHYCLQAIKMFHEDSKLHVEKDTVTVTTPVPDYLFYLATGEKAVKIKSISYVLYENAKIIKSEYDSYLCNVFVAEYRNDSIFRTTKAEQIRINKNDMKATKPIVISAEITDSEFEATDYPFDDKKIDKDSVLRCQLALIEEVAPKATITIQKMHSTTKGRATLFCYNNIFDVSTTFFCEIVRDGKIQSLDSAYMPIPNTQLLTKIIFNKADENKNQSYISLNSVAANTMDTNRSKPDCRKFRTRKRNLFCHRKTCR